MISAAVLLFVAASVLAVAPAAGRDVAIEHMYFDVRQTFLRAAVDAPARDHPAYVTDNAGTVLTPITAKAKCKGAGCPELDGVAVRIEGSKWPSLHDRTIYVEETAGWYLLWQNEQRTVPVVPEYEEIERVFDANERGYLGPKTAGKIIVR
jgi:hypothetical protein